MKNLFTLIALLSCTTTFFAQTVQIAVGAGYQKQAYYSLATDATTTVTNTAWDIAFSVFGQQDAGIFVNEASGSAAGVPISGVEVYKAPTNAFADVIDATTIKDRLYNEEQTWAYGAFNSERDATNPFDYGWAVYNSATKIVEGKKVFVLKLRDGSYKKIEFQNLTLTKYNFRYADLDGKNEKTATVDKKDNAGKNLAYFSFATNSNVEVEPKTGGFDLLYTRYVSLVTQGATTAQYNVTGILTNRNVEVAKVSGVDPKTVKLNDYKNNFSKKIETIGSDWKTIDINTNKWSLPTDRVYFVKTIDNTVWKLVFVDFEGSATGIATFEKTNLGKLVAVNDITSDIQFKVFPTIVENEVTVAMNATTTQDMTINVVNMNGQIIASQAVTANTGFQVMSLPLANLNAGTYIVSLQTKEGVATSKIVKK